MPGGPTGADDIVRITAERRLHAGTIHAKGNSGLLGHPRNIIKRFLHLCSSAMNAQDKEAIAKEVDSFINEDLAHLELLLQAKELEIEVAAEGTKHLQHCQEQLQDQLQAVEAQILACLKELEVSKVYKQHQEEYEIIKEEIMKLPSRANTEREIAEVLAETENLKLESACVDKDLELMRKHFAHLSVVLQNLTASASERSPCIEDDAAPMDVE